MPATSARYVCFTPKCLYRHIIRQTHTAGTEDLYGYWHSEIRMVGTITLSVCYRTKALPSFTLQVSHHGANLMDLVIFHGISLLDNGRSAIAAGEKVQLCYASHEVWGLLLTADGISALPFSVEAAQLALFLGMTACSLRFLPQYLTTTAQPREPLKKGRNLDSCLLCCCSLTKDTVHLIACACPI